MFGCCVEKRTGVYQNTMKVQKEEEGMSWRATWITEREYGSDGGKGAGRGFLQPEIGHWKGQIAIREAAPPHS